MLVAPGDCIYIHWIQDDQPKSASFGLRHKEMRDCRGSKTIEHVVNQRLEVVKR